jgi:hypothetical protein
LQSTKKLLRYIIVPIAEAAGITYTAMRVVNTISNTQIYISPFVAGFFSTAFRAIPVAAAQTVAFAKGIVTSIAALGPMGWAGVAAIAGFGLYGLYNSIKNRNENSEIVNEDAKDISNLDLQMAIDLSVASKFFFFESDFKRFFYAKRDELKIHNLLAYIEKIRIRVLQLTNRNNWSYLSDQFEELFAKVAHYNAHDYNVLVASVELGKDRIPIANRIINHYTEKNNLAYAKDKELIDNIMAYNDNSIIDKIDAFLVDNPEFLAAEWPQLRKEGVRDRINEIIDNNNALQAASDELGEHMRTKAEYELLNDIKNIQNINIYLKIIEIDDEVLLVNLKNFPTLNAINDYRNSILLKIDAKIQKRISMYETYANLIDAFIGNNLNNKEKEIVFFLAITEKIMLYHFKFIYPQFNDYYKNGNVIFKIRDLNFNDDKTESPILTTNNILYEIINNDGKINEIGKNNVYTDNNIGMGVINDKIKVADKLIFIRKYSKKTELTNEEINRINEMIADNVEHKNLKFIFANLPAYLNLTAPLAASKIKPQLNENWRFWGVIANFFNLNETIYAGIARQINALIPLLRAAVGIDQADINFVIYDRPEISAYYLNSHDNNLTVSLICQTLFAYIFGDYYKTANWGFLANRVLTDEEKELMLVSVSLSKITITNDLKKNFLLTILNMYQTNPNIFFVGNQNGVAYRSFLATDLLGKLDRKIMARAFVEGNLLSFI